MFRPPSGHLQVFILCMLKEPAVCYFRLFGVAPCIATVMLCLVSPVLVCLYHHFNFDELRLHERLYFKVNNSKEVVCTGLNTRYTIS
jgi:hypothetical protein